jgi:DNA-binding NtrC family response regulator
MLKERGRSMPPEQRKRRVFVVDDEPVIASTLAMILRQVGFEATSFTEPLEALKAAKAEAPDLLISDVVMPALSGVDLAIQMQESCPDCKVLLFSGQSATAGMLDAGRANGHDFELLLKPVHPKDLLREIEKVTAKSSLPQ